VVPVEPEYGWEERITVIQADKKKNMQKRSALNKENPPSPIPQSRTSRPSSIVELWGGEHREENHRSQRSEDEDESKK